MTYPGDMWMVAFVFTPMMVMALAAVAGIASYIAARQHDAKRAAESKAWCDRMAGK